MVFTATVKDIQNILLICVLGASKFRGFDLRLREEVSFSRDETRITDSLQKLSTEVRTNGRRSACTKLKRTLAEEKEGQVPSKKIKQRVKSKIN